MSVRVVDGSVIQSTQLVPSASWSIGSCQFQHDLKVLPLHSYDIILGMDWLQPFSPMKIDWRQRWLTIPYQGRSISLHDVSAQGSDSHPELLVQISCVQDEPKQKDRQISPAIIQLLSEFSEITKPPTALPPRRSCDHTIPLVDGARPVNVRPYRYPLALKDEIEAQVDSMLQQGIIQPSTSPFNSPVLLVRKKDASWRFCLDNRYLNAITVKTVFPIPVFEQLMDELAGAE